MSTGQVMRAAQLDGYGDAEVLRVRDVRRPSPAAGQVLVRVGATSVNPHDVFLRSGKARLLSGSRFPLGTGSDLAGTIVEVGEGVDALMIGERVWGFNPGLAHRDSAAAAGFLALPADRVSRLPASLTDSEAVSLVAGGTVSIVAFRDRLALRGGERVLIRGASGGVGSIAVQYAHARGGLVTALAGSRSLDLVSSLGAVEAHDHRTTSAASLGTFDVIFDAVGTQLNEYRRLLAPGGRMVTITIGSAGSVGAILSSLLHGTRRVRFFSGSPKRELLESLTETVEDGSVKPVIDTVYALDAIQDAHRAVEAGGSRGKHVVAIG